MEGFTPRSEEDARSRFDQVGPGYFSNLGIPLLLGRDIKERDSATAPRVAVINETMAKFYRPYRCRSVCQLATRSPSVACRSHKGAAV